MKRKHTEDKDNGAADSSVSSTDQHTDPVLDVVDKKSSINDETYRKRTRQDDLETSSSR